MPSVNETPAEPGNQAEAADIPASPPIDPVVVMLEEYLAKAKAGELRDVLIGFIYKTGKAGMRMTPMAAQEANHLSRILDVRVQREYAAMLFQPQGGPRAPVSQGGGSASRNLSPKEAAVVRQAMQRKVVAAVKKKKANKGR